MRQAKIDMKRLFIVHGWEGHPTSHWIPWLKEQAENQGFAVFAPQMPDTNTPDMSAWISTLATLVETPDTQTYFVGHSLGVQAILRYLETIHTSIGGIVSVAGFFTLLATSLDENATRILKPWLTLPIDTDKVKHNSSKIVAIFSDNDAYVGLDNVDLFKNRLLAKTLVLSQRGHFSTKDGALELPEALEELVKMQT